MRWTSKDVTKWHEWFAWHPVKIGDQWVWLETVSRRYISYNGWLGYDYA